MNNNDLYQKKYQYEILIKNLNDALKKLDACYSNLLSCEKKIMGCVLIDDKYYLCNCYQKIIKTIDDNRYNIKYKLLPKARYQYNKILSDIAIL